MRRALGGSLVREPSLSSYLAGAASGGGPGGAWWGGGWGTGRLGAGPLRLAGAALILWVVAWLVIGSMLLEGRGAHFDKSGDLTPAAALGDVVEEVNRLRHEVLALRAQAKGLRGRAPGAGGAGAGAASWTGDAAMLADPVAMAEMDGPGAELQCDRDVRGRDVERKAGAVHVMVTSNGNRYMNWQTRIFYQTYLEVRAMDGGDVFEAFTRVLHRTSHDELSVEIPTMRYDPEHPECDVYCPYPVKDRAAVILRWLHSHDAKRAEFVLISETDYLFVQPIKVPPDLPPMHAIGFPFAYIVPEYDGISPIMKRYYDKGPLSDIPTTGNAPVLARIQEYKSLVPAWIDIVHRIDKDEEAVEKLAWIREMYAYSLAAANVKLVHDLPRPPFSPVMCQPGVPGEDDDVGIATLLHYTWGSTFVTDDEARGEVWKMEKREYAGGWNAQEPKVPKLEELPPFPPFVDGGLLRAEDNSTITQGRYESIRTMHLAFNGAVRALNSVNGGVPRGFESWEAAYAATAPSEAAKRAHKAWEEGGKRGRRLLRGKRR